MSENQKICILTIDDEPAIRQSIKAYLEDYDYYLIEAENGKIGIKLIDKHHPDLVLVDLRMPEVDGLDVLRMSTKKYPNLPIIVVSGTGVIADAIEAVHLGAWDYILKPIQDMSILLHAVKKCLERSRLIKENNLHREHLQEEVTARTKDLKESNQLLESEIIAHKKTLTALRQSERKLDSIIMAVPDIIYRLDANGKISFISHSVKRYGYSPEELVGTHILDIIHPDDRSIAVNHLNERRTGSRKTISLEVRFVSRKNDSASFEISSRGVDMDPVFLIEAEGLYDAQKKNDKKFVGTQGIARDVTERKLAERKLLDSEERLDLAIQGADLGLWDWDLLTNLITYNKQWATLLGLSSDSLIISAADMESLIHSDDRDSFLRLMADHLNSESTLLETELRFLTNKEDWKWIQLRGKVVSRNEKGEAIRFTGTQLDITRRKRAEASLQQLAAATEQASDAIILFDTSLNIQYANPAFNRYTGYDAEEVINESLNNLHLFDIDRKLYSEMLERIKNKRSWEGKLSQVKRDGEVMIIEASVSPIRNPQGIITNYVMVQRDISKEEKLSDQLRQAQKMESVGRLAGGVAHDFNNIITVISGYGSLSLSKLGIDHPLAKNIQQILNASQRAESLTRQLLAFSRKQVLQPKVINLNHTLKNINKMLYRLISEDIEFTSEYDKKLGHINVDPGQMEQVIMNLVVNARDAMPVGGKLKIRTENTQLSASHQFEFVEAKPGNYILLTVSDTGIGMSEAVVKHIFEPFYTTKESGKGTGLGLSTVYGIVHQSNGFISVDSEPGEGSSFKVFLPQIDSEIESIKENMQIEHGLSGKEHIVVVEDQMEVRDLIQSILNDYGYNVLPAIDGLDTIQKLSQLKKAPHLLLTDVVMPKLKVSEMVEKIQELFPKLKILYMSGYTDDVIIHHGVLDKDKEFIQKPFSPIELVKKVRKVLDKS